MAGDVRLQIHLACRSAEQLRPACSRKQPCRHFEYVTGDTSSCMAHLELNLPVLAGRANDLP